MRKGMVLAATLIAMTLAATSAHAGALGNDNLYVDWRPQPRVPYTPGTELFPSGARRNSRQAGNPALRPVVISPQAIPPQVIPRVIPQVIPQALRPQAIRPPEPGQGGALPQRVVTPSGSRLPTRGLPAGRGGWPARAWAPARR